MTQQISVAARGRRGLGRVFPRQSHFSLVTAALAAMLLVTLVADLIVGHPHFDRAAVIAWVASYLVLTLLPLICGDRCPAWLGLLLVAYLTFWSAFSLSHTNHAHMEVNALLESPMVAVYLGWFFRSWLARFVLALHLL
ncbi:MAG: GGDEF domain-containing protein, partial [Actinobacteria bacterium]|nr:GGDEF domain-containing protein [Actinomycetota bacterium]